MLKVLPVQSKEEQKELCALCNIEYKPDMLAYAATVDGEFCGLSQFKLSDKGGIVCDIANTANKFDRQAIFVLGRATLNFIDLCGIHRAFYDGDESIPGAQLLHAIGFRKNDEGRLEMDLTDFFTTPCKHCKS